jgi:Rrf2 family transcriptional regulator, cysteine metabolism repressor
VEQILMKLKTAGLVQSHRGARGGFSLACEPRETDVSAILRATEGPVALAPCTEGECERATTCVTRPVWERAAEALQTVFSGITLDELAREAIRLQASKAPDYHI